MVFGLEMFTMKHDSSYYCQRIMSDFFQKNILEIKKSFASCSSSEEKYRHLMHLGSLLSPLPSHLKIESNLVPGCQSRLYLACLYNEGHISFLASSDALISAGLAALLIAAYNEVPPVTLFQCPPDFLQELGIVTSLSPNRSHGLANIYLRMKKDALLLLAKQKQ